MDMISLRYWLWICSKIKAAAEVRSANLVGAMLRCAIDDRDLRSEPMFQQLVKRCSIEQ